MSRTTRKVHREPELPFEHWSEWEEWWYWRRVRGLSLQSSVSPPLRSGGYLCDWMEGPSTKKYYKRLTAQLRRREAKIKLRRW